MGIRSSRLGTGAVNQATPNISLPAPEPQMSAARESENITISVDLVTTAKTQLAFLQAVDHVKELYHPDVAKLAVQRYEHLWLPLLAKHPNTDLAPPLDVEWAWHCHVLCPTRYATDCQTVAGVILDKPVFASSSMRQDASRKARLLWRREYGQTSFDMNYAECEKKDFPPTRFQYDLVSAMGRQQVFYFQVAAPHFQHPDFLRLALKRYKRFLFMMKTMGGGGLAVPMYDIDLMWHAHQASDATISPIVIDVFVVLVLEIIRIKMGFLLTDSFGQMHPLAYARDTTAVLGQVASHDDSVNDRTPGGRLDTNFTATSQLYRQLFREMYVLAGTRFRGVPVTSSPEFQPQAGFPSLTLCENTLSFSILPSPNYEDTAAAVVRRDSVRQIFSGILQVNSFEEDADTHRMAGLRSIRYVVRAVFDSACTMQLKDKQSCTVGSHKTRIRRRGFWERHWFEADTNLVGLELEVFCGKLVLGEKSVGRATLSLDNSVFQNLGYQGWLAISDTLKVNVSLSITPPMPGHVKYNLTKVQKTTDWSNTVGVTNTHWVHKTFEKQGYPSSAAIKLKTKLSLSRKAILFDDRTSPWRKMEQWMQNVNSWSVPSPHTKLESTDTVSGRPRAFKLTPELGTSAHFYYRLFEGPAFEFSTAAPSAQDLLVWTLVRYSSAPTERCGRAVALINIAGPQVVCVEGSDEMWIMFLANAMCHLSRDLGPRKMKSQLKRVAAENKDLIHTPSWRSSKRGLRIAGEQGSQRSEQRSGLESGPVTVSEEAGARRATDGGGCGGGCGGFYYANSADMGGGASVDCEGQGGEGGGCGGGGCGGGGCGGGG